MITYNITYVMHVIDRKQSFTAGYLLLQQLKKQNKQKKTCMVEYFAPPSELTCYSINVILQEQFVR